jgi:hypothetical protein
LTPAGNACSYAGMSNVLADDKHQQILALGRLGWTLRRIEDTTGVRRETASAYLKAAGIGVRSRGRPGTGPPKPAISEGVSTDSAAGSVAPKPGRAPAASACEPYRDFIEEALGRGRNAVAIWQDLVDDHGFIARYASVRRFVVKLRGSAPAEARVVITTAPGEEGQVDYGEGPMVRDPNTGRYRRTRLIDEIADATLDGTRKIFFADLATVPLLIIDDLGTRKLPHTAAEDLLELIMRRYERASTVLTSNRPVRRLGQATRRHSRGDRAARPPPSSRPRPQVRTPQLAHQSANGLADGNRSEVNITRLDGRPEMAGFAVSINGRI